MLRNGIYASYMLTSGKDMSCLVYVDKLFCSMSRISWIG